MKIIFSFMFIIFLISFIFSQNIAPESVLTNSDSSTTCQTNICGPFQCSSNGFCLNNLTCLCSVGFTSYPDNSTYQCCYKRKSQINAFLLELFVSFGAGHMYIGRSDIAGAKIAVFLLLIILNIFIHSALICYRKKGKIWRVSKFIIIATSITCFLTWQTVDLIVYGSNKYVDSNGVTLKEW